MLTAFAKNRSMPAPKDATLALYSSHCDIWSDKPRNRA